MNDTNQKLPRLSPRLQRRLNALMAEFSDQQFQPEKLLAQHRLLPGSRRLLFFFLGYVAKAEGRVTETDIRYTESLMQGLNLGRSARRKAIARFHQGRDSKTLPALKGTGLRLLLSLRLNTCLLIALCLCHASQLGGRPGKPKRYRCEDALDQIGLPLEVMDDIFACYAREIWQANLPARPKSYHDACQILGVSSRDTFDAIKKSYRREVSKVHPDKLSGTLTRAQEERARDQLMRLQQAWEIVRSQQRMQ